MKKLALALLLLLPTTVLAATDKPNPADFPIKLHIISSAAQTFWSDKITIYTQVLETVIDNQLVELRDFDPGVLALGDYQARLSTKVHPLTRHPSTYDIYRGYDLLMPDGTTRTYTVTRLGPAPTNP